MKSSFNKLIFIFVAVFFLNHVSCVHQEINPTSTFINEIDNAIPNWLNEFVVPGAAVAIIDNGEVLLQKGYGYADVLNQIRVNENTGFNIASISKTITAWGIMKLVEEGKLGLDSSAEKYLTRWHIPGSEYDVKKVTIRRLLSHTAGLSLHGYPGWSPEDTLPTIEESLSGKSNGAGAVELILEPGTQWKYSGGAYTLLQLIVEEVTGKSFADYMQIEVLNPLGMTNSSFYIDDKIATASSKEYNSFGEEIPFEHFTAQAAAGLHTTIKDLTRFALANLNLPSKKQTILKQSTLDLMQMPAPEANGMYGLGFRVGAFMNSSTILVGHRGSNDGWQATMQLNRKTGDGFIMLTNGASGDKIHKQVYCKWSDLKLGTAIANPCRKSIAPLLIKSYLDAGLDSSINAFRLANSKERDQYFIHEGDINMFGYELLWRKKIKDAIKIFELIIEEYPASSNAYDSYGEALLVDGQDSLGILNYIKSIELNPVNEKAIEVLKTLGINTDTLGYKISLAELKTFEGEYLAERKRRNENRDWKIQLKLKGRYLYGNDLDYQFKLIPIRKNEFFNPDVGVKLVFEKDNEKVKSFLMFSKGRFQKLD